MASRWKACNKFQLVDETKVARCVVQRNSISYDFAILKFASFRYRKMENFPETGGIVNRGELAEKRGHRAIVTRVEFTALFSIGEASVSGAALSVHN